ncbi:MAG: metal ABC transporter permease [Bacteroides sp.]|nr:metal ABC transporter permease [Bacteroides sp.]MBD5418752.1 metal ABC transporter permease [Bacteroides sp.]
MFGFMQNATLGVTLISIAAAIIGTYIVTRRMVFISGGITHACFGGLGLGYFLGISPMLMAGVFAVGGALGVDWLSKRGARKDSAIAVIWALGMALGILFIFLTSGYVPELNTFLFGNVLTITQGDLLEFAVFTGVLILFFALFYPLIVTVSFDADFARTRNLPVKWIDMAMTVLVAVGIVMTIRLIGIMLLMSLVSLPQMIAERFTGRYLRLLLLSVGISLIGGLGGLWIAWLISVPASAAIVLLLIALYGAASLMPVRRLR